MARRESVRNRFPASRPSVSYMNPRLPLHREFAEFARTWLRSPRRVGAILPSGPSLARAITAAVSKSTGSVLELGPGTGVFTRALVSKGIPEESLTLLESDARFARMLRTRFPAAQVISGCASALKDLPLLESGFGAVISGLPLLSMPPATVQLILSGALAHLRPGKMIYQFTYRPFCPVPQKVLMALDLEARVTGFSLCNLPPAWVFSLSRKSGV